VVGAVVGLLFAGAKSVSIRRACTGTFRMSVTSQSVLIAGAGTRTAAQAAHHWSSSRTPLRPICGKKSVRLSITGRPSMPELTGIAGGAYAQQATLGAAPPAMREVPTVPIKFQ
jgi:hypothetical protein